MSLFSYGFRFPDDSDLVVIRPVTGLSEKLHIPNFFLKIRTHRKTVDIRFRPSYPENMTFRGRNPELESHPEFSGFFLMTRDESLTFSGVCVYLMTKQKPEFDPFPVSGWP